MHCLPWIEPLDLAAGLMESTDDPYWVLLYSAIHTSYSGRYSYLAYDLKQRITGDDFSVLADALTDTQPRYANAWFGYLGYGLKNSLETLATDSENWLKLPHLCMMQFATIIVFDHEERSVAVHSGHSNPRIPKAVAHTHTYLPRVNHITSNMIKKVYLEKVASIIENIHSGDLYQANLTRKFIGTFEETPDAFSLFRKLCSVSPAPYSSFISLNGVYTLSSSPELFLNIDENGHIRTRPIKGTSARSSDEALDRQSRTALAASTKDRAENLMIVDLMRNDLSRSCVPGSVTTPSLFEVTSHAAVHHMSSTIMGLKAPECTPLETIMHCFPPGSMTGAPKIRAMNLCSELEQLERGLYSGAIGWLGGDGSAELSVVIRTLILKDRQFEFQVGGGIVADSIPEKEFAETIDKARGLLAALNISSEIIESI